MIDQIYDSMYKIDPDESKDNVQLTGPLRNSVNFATGANGHNQVMRLLLK
jgi:hypothetical protein